MKQPTHWEAPKGLAIACLLFVLLMLAGCERAATEPSGGLSSAGTPAQIPSAPPATVVPAGPTLAPTSGTRAATSAPTAVPVGTVIATRPAPQATPTLLPVQASPTPLPPPPATNTPISGPTMTVKVYMIALEDNGKSGPKVGCGDSAIAVNRVVARTTAVLTAAMKELVSIKSRTIGQSGLFNALYQSTLSVDYVQLVGTKATVRLKGQTQIGGTCDAPRVIAQFRYTALQFSTVKDVAVLVNGVPIETVLSTR